MSLFDSAKSAANSVGKDFKATTDGLKAEFRAQKDGSANEANYGVPSVFPWTSVNTESRYFAPISIDAKRWDQLFPYRLVVIDTSKKGNPVVNGDTNTNFSVRKELGRTAIQFEALTSQWIYTLPITPQQLQITDQYAISTTATLLGVLEEHSGLKFKMISASGTMGVWPFRSNVTSPPADNSANIVQSVFGGAIQAANNAISQAVRTINTVTSKSIYPQPVSQRPENTSEGLSSTGYYHAMALQTFLEQYAEAKKDPATKAGA